MPNTHSTLTSLFSDIADSIRAKTGVDGTIVADEFPDAIDDIPTGVTPTGSVSITENGTYDVTEKASAIVNVASAGGNINIGDYTETIETITVGANSITKCHEIGAYFLGASTKGVVAFAKSGVGNSFNNVNFACYNKGGTINPSAYTDNGMVGRYNSSWTFVATPSQNYDAVLVEGSVWEVHRYD